MFKYFLISISAFYRNIRAYFVYRGPVLDAFFCAIALHGDQKRKYTGEPYWFHLDDVAFTLYRIGQRDPHILSAALLHDSVEDVPHVTLDHLLIFCTLTKKDFPNYGLVPERIVKLVRELTDVYVKIDFPHLNRSHRKALELKRISEVSAEAKLIKLADIASNLPSIKKHDPEFYGVYRSEITDLLPALQGIHPALYRSVFKRIHAA